MMVRLEVQSSQVAANIERFVPTQVKLLGQMGLDLADEVARMYPDFPRREVPRSWEQHLPATSPHVQRTLERHV